LRPRLAPFVLLAACGAFCFAPTREARPSWDGLATAVVRRASFDACVTAGGVAQSSEQTVVRCRLENLQLRRNGREFLVGGASTILDIVPNGITVKKDDVLCTLDASDYEEVAHGQELNVLSHEAEVVQTRLQFEAAQIVLIEYRDGLFPRDILGLKGQIALAESDAKLASERLAWSEKMLAFGYAAPAKVADDRLVSERAAHRLSQARMELETYRRFVARKTLTALEAEYENRRSWYIHEVCDYDKSKSRLAYYRSLIDRCTIRAPYDGFVVYANGPFREEADRGRIEPGAPVRQEQELFYFPDLTKMGFVAMLNETVVDRVREGMPVRVRLEGAREAACEGHVASVAGLPKWGYNEVPYYPCRITLDVFPPGLLPEQTGAVEIQIGRCRDVLAIPNEAVYVDHDRSLCCVIGPSGLERRAISTGGSTPELIEVAGELKEGETVVLNPKGLLERLDGLADPASPVRPEMHTIAAYR
jgi:HlyD family secretion protein